MMKPATLLLPFLLVPMASPPDVVPSGLRGIHFTLTVDPGAFAANLCRRYTVVAGDTLEAIAKRECGDASCVEEIRLLNPETKSGKVDAGASLIIPPRVVTTDSRAASRSEGGGTTQWVFFHKGWAPAPILANEALSLPPGPSYVLAVPRSKLECLLRPDWKGPEAAEGVAISDVLPDDHFVKERDPTWSVEATVLLKAVKDGRVLVEVSKKKFDKNGKVIGSRGAPRRGDLSSAIMLVTAAAALLAVVRLAVTRRRRARQAG
jgi:hypothetical protein